MGFSSENIVIDAGKDELNHDFVIYYLTILVYTKKSYSPQCQRLVLNIYLAASYLRRYTPLTTSPSMKSC